MSCNKYLSHLIFPCKLNVKSMPLLCVRNLSLVSDIPDKLKLEKKKVIISDELKVEIQSKQKTSKRRKNVSCEVSDKVTKKKSKIPDRIIADYRLFGRVLQKKKGKYTQLIPEQAEGKPKSAGARKVLDSEDLWIMKISNPNHIKYISYKTTKNVKNEISNGNKSRPDTKINTIINTENIEIQNTKKCTLETVSDFTSDGCTAILQKAIERITSYPIRDVDTSIDCFIEYKESEGGTHIPSVTHILRETMSAQSKRALEIWKENMIKKLGQEQFDIFCKELLVNGKLFHTCVENTLLQKEIEIPLKVEPTYNSVKSVLNDVQTVKNLEAYVMHPNLRYKGVVDCIACYRDKVCVIDWKQSEKRKSTLASTYDAPVQLAAYVGALNASDNYPFMIDMGVVVIAYTNGDPATVHVLENDVLEKSWKDWLKRLQQYYTHLIKKD
ncbi:uncharacterized protein LOC128876218 [Hylaeus volcanicus]|uniref:uncharacterized protein LOC128876218 n=1 Tax=Hylaeus volcanicus TaxID=313075 RepID=UPI0023B7EC26|nr:uncharacterized protein LOC128876218 [Hylaeus volcanicus]